MEEQMNFFEQNDMQVSARLSKILLWMTLVFPALFLFSAIGVFQMQMANRNGRFGGAERLRCAAERSGFLIEFI